MVVLESFKSYLYDKDLSEVTIKSYYADVSKFIRWYEGITHTIFSPDAIQKSDIYSFERQFGTSLSSSSQQRYISSLRTFFTYLLETNKVGKNIFEKEERYIRDEAIWHLNAFKDYLYLYGSAELTIKNYINDILFFKGWFEEYHVIYPGSKISYYFTSEHTAEYKSYLLTNAPGTVHRRLSSIRRYITFIIDQGYLQTSFISETKQYWHYMIENDNRLGNVYKNMSYIYNFVVIFLLGFISSMYLLNINFFTTRKIENQASVNQAENDVFVYNNLNPSSYGRIWSNVQKLNAGDSQLLSMVLQNKDPKEEFHKIMTEKEIALVISSEFVSLNPYNTPQFIAIQHKSKKTSRLTIGPINEAEVMYTKLRRNLLSQSLETMNACVLFGCQEIIRYISIYKPIFNLPPFKDTTVLYVTKQEDTYRSILHILAETNKKEVKVAVSKPINNSLPINLIVVQ